MKKLICALAVLTSCAHSEARDIAGGNFPGEQAEVQARLNEVWDAAGKRDFARLSSYHLYGPKFAEFKDGAPRGDAASGEAGERQFFSMLAEQKVEMQDLKVSVFGDVAVASFHGAFSGKIEGKPVAEKQQSTLVLVKDKGSWKVAHEHFSALGPPPHGP